MTSSTSKQTPSLTPNPPIPNCLTTLTILERVANETCRLVPYGIAGTLDYLHHGRNQRQICRDASKAVLELAEQCHKAAKNGHT